ncbi:MAG: cytochrome c biogenesis protein CcsA [Bacteroidota bacterium]|nr:cytochrome c biogenesis protein CcsA [Bacteroidota bacterium]
MEYIGEHLGIGQLGNVFVILSFVFALLASISYFFAARDNEECISWKRIGRIAFRIHSLSVIGIVATLFVMLMNHYFEYEYVWHHSNKAMPMQYILSCFWEGQEGSFLLWSFWHVVLGLILQRTAKNWEAPVMAVISMVQVFLASMLLGIVLFEHKIGSNPFTILLREHPDFSNIPLFKNADYLSKIDGNGLNPLLQNYWMTIHPPTLFLGFALTVVPFAYAIAGLWKKKFGEWQQAALPWTYAGVCVLGTGILMGGAWAYEALSFGGFWAWDPVENASLVPWLTLVGAAHVMIINKNNNQSLFTTFLLAILTFILILYSTFLTRSGILGETSVHAFTDLGMSGQLLLYLLFFLFLGIFFLLVDTKYKLWYTLASILLGVIAVTLGYKAWVLSAWVITSVVFLILTYSKFFPKVKEEEGLWSREFWMFVGAIVLLISSFQIMFYTSLPVWNKLFDTNKAPAQDIIQFYNNWQLPFAFLVTLLIAVTQFFRYKDTDFKLFLKKIGKAFIIAVGVSVILFFTLNFSNFYYALLLFSSVFAAVANADYFIRILKGKVKKAGASIAHIGFALILLGALISTSKKEVISQNTSGTSIESLGEKFSNSTNILLTKGDTLPMGRYLVTYKGRRFEGINVYFDVDYFTRDKQGILTKEFSLSPLFQINPRMGNVPEPDTRHFLTYDVYTHVTYAVLQDPKANTPGHADEYDAAKNFSIKKGDTIFSSNAIIILDSLSTNFDKKEYNLTDDDIAVMANFSVQDIKVKHIARPVFVIRNNSIQPIAAKVDELGLQFMFWKLNTETSSIDISLQEKKSNKKDFIVMEAMIFPYINILWIGCFVMIVGTIFAILERIRKK